MIKEIVSKLKNDTGPTLDSSVFYPGGKLEGQWIIKNGVVPSQGSTIALELILEYHDGQLHTQKRIQLQHISESRKQNKNGFILSFSAHLPDDIPISCSNISYKVQAGIRAGKSRVRLHFLPVCIKGSHEVLQIFYALGALGFREVQHSGIFNGKKQIFRFAPSVFLSPEIQELHVSSIEKRRNGISIFLNVMKRGDHRKAEHQDMIFLSSTQLKSRRCVEEELKGKLLTVTE
ncbi:sporulation protein [Fictibacillus enclensis]|uniref:sporulation protein n=1 Tax=Fictibacillus enclensis TaxID=1017270 RepID=UPI00259FEC6A|nr:sporulation protein [Fictibacillus enclensis]MDM5336800.1 sporulation protein [Fictibacillus enclensis]